MKGLSKIKSYLFTPNKCFIPICKARCCGDAPLPEDFASRYKNKIQRDIYGAAYIGHNDITDNYNSVVYNTRPIPLLLIGHAGKGNEAYFFDKKLAKQLNMSQDDAVKYLQAMEANEQYNYCPFLNAYGRCSVYDHRPPICREFGTSPLKINHCSRKSSRWDIIKFAAKEWSLKRFILNLNELLKQKFQHA